MRQRIYLDGKPAWTDNEPARARVSGYGGSAIGHTLTLIKYTKPSPIPLREKDRRRAEKRRRGLGLGLVYLMSVNVCPMALPP